MTNINIIWERNISHHAGKCKNNTIWDRKSTLIPALLSWSKLKYLWEKPLVISERQNVGNNKVFIDISCQFIDWTQTEFLWSEEIWELALNEGYNYLNDGGYSWCFNNYQKRNPINWSLLVSVILPVWMFGWNIFQFCWHQDKMREEIRAG